MPKTVSAEAAVRHIHARGPGRVFLQGGCAEPLVLREAWKRDPELAAGLQFCAVLLPGVNTFDYAQLHAEARLEAFLLTPEIEHSLMTGRATLSPLHYSDVHRALLAKSYSAAILHVSPPDADGRCSLGLSADTADAALLRAPFKVAVINGAMPWIDNAPSVALCDFDLIVECDAPLAEATAPAPGPEAPAIARHVAELVEDGACIQSGIGRLPAALMRALRNKTDLTLHSGLIAPAHVELAEAGCFRSNRGALTAGLALGDNAFYRRLASEPRLRIASIATTHDHAELSAIGAFTAVNTALEVDLLGQINAEFVGDRRVACVGGLVDFIRGAHASPGGRAIVALPSAGRGGSRIVPRLASQAVTVAAADAPIIVTEHGVADLRFKDVEARAEALVAIADPAHREDLTRAWRGRLA